MGGMTPTPRGAEHPTTDLETLALEALGEAPGRQQVVAVVGEKDVWHKLQLHSKSSSPTGRQKSPQFPVARQ